MPLNISDAQDSFLYGRAEFNKWADQFMTRWLMPELLLWMAAAVNDAKRSGAFWDNPVSVIKTEALVRKLTGKE